METPLTTGRDAVFLALLAISEQKVPEAIIGT